MLDSKHAGTKNQMINQLNAWGRILPDKQIQEMPHVL